MYASNFAGPALIPIGSTRWQSELADLHPDAILGQTTPVIKALAREMPKSPIVFIIRIRSNR